MGRKKDIYLSFVVLFQMIVVTIQLLLPLLGLASVEQAAYYRVIITLSTYIPGIYIVLTRNTNAVIITFVVYFIVLLLNYALFPASHRFIESSAVYSLTPISLLTALFIYSIRDIKQFSKILLFISRVSLFIALLYIIAYNLSPLRTPGEEYSMSFGYSMLLPAMFLFTQKSLVDKFSSLIFLALILLGGSRGPVIVLVTFYIVHLFLFGSTKEWKRLVPFAILAFVSLVILLPKYVDLESSRTIRLLMGGELISHDSGRGENVYAVVRPHIMERPITGWGIGADRFFLDGFYSHNVFLEIYLHYGIVIGTFIFGWFFLWCLRTYSSKKLKRIDNGKVMFIMMFLYGFVPLLVSSSYLIEFRVAVMAGYFLWLARHMKSMKVRKKEMRNSQLVLEQES